MTRTFLAKATSVATVAFAAVSFASVAQAQNTINFNGSVQVNDPDRMTGASSGQLLIDFVPVGLGTGNIMTVDVTDLPGLGSGSAGTVRDLTATPTGFNAVPSLVQVGGYTFTLESSDPGTGAFNFGPIGVSQKNSLTVTASFDVFGKVTGPGSFGTRNYFGVFTADFTAPSIGRPAFTPLTVAQFVSAVDGGTVASVSYRANFDIGPGTTVPEPSTYALMASGVAMLGAFAHRRRQQA